MTPIEQAAIAFIEADDLAEAASYRDHDRWPESLTLAHRAKVKKAELKRAIEGDQR